MDTNQGNQNNNKKATEQDINTQKRRVVLGEEEYERAGAEPSYSRSFPQGDQPVPEYGEGSYHHAQEDREPEPPGFFSRLFQRGEEVTPDDMTDMTEEARRRLREQNGSPIFDAQADQRLAEESTKAVPAGLLGAEREAANPAARRLNQADSEAARGKVTEPNRDRQPLNDRQRRDRRMKNRAIAIGVLLLITAILFLTVPLIQAAMFRTTGDSLIFSPARGLFGPRAGILEIVMGLIGMALFFYTLIGKRKEESLSKKQAASKQPTNPLRTLGLILMLLIPIGFAAQFNFTELRNNDIRFSSLFNQNKIANYGQVATQDVASGGEDVFYTLTVSDAGSVKINVSDLPKETVRLLDAKLPPTRDVRFTSSTIDKLVEQGIYTKDEAIRIFFNKQ